MLPTVDYSIGGLMLVNRNQSKKFSKTVVSHTTTPHTPDTHATYLVGCTLEHPVQVVGQQPPQGIDHLHTLCGKWDRVGLCWVVLGQLFLNVTQYMCEPQAVQYMPEAASMVADNLLAAK